MHEQRIGGEAVEDNSSEQEASSEMDAVVYEEAWIAWLRSNGHQAIAIVYGK